MSTGEEVLTYRSDGSLELSGSSPPAGVGFIHGAWGGLRSGLRTTRLQCLVHPGNESQTGHARVRSCWLRNSPRQLGFFSRRQPQSTSCPSGVSLSPTCRAWMASGCDTHTDICKHQTSSHSFCCRFRHRPRRRIRIALVTSLLGGGWPVGDAISTFGAALG